MIAPGYAQRTGARVDGQRHVEGGVADHQGILRRNAELRHSVLQNLGMRLAGAVVRGLQGDEIPAQAMALQAGSERPPALAGSDAQKDMRMIKGF